MEEVSSKSSQRTIIRDPRKAKRFPSRVVATIETEESSISNKSNQNPRLPFEPSAPNQQSLGLGSYMLAGVGVAMGVTLVSAIFGASG